MGSPLVRLATAIFWGSAVLAVQALAVYPLAVHARARRAPRPARRGPVDVSVTCVVAARNEAAVIGERLANLLASAFPPERLEIVVVSDASTDDTDAIVAGWTRRTAGRVRLVRTPVARGKATAINAGLAAARGDVVVFGDARQRFASGAIAALVENFADPEVGAVSGHLDLEPGPDGGGQALDAYWRFERALRRAESATGSAVGCTGAIYAVRRALVGPLPEGTILDDVLVPMRIALDGHRVVFEPRAQAFDRCSALRGREFTRKVRTVAGNVQLLRLCPALVDVRRGQAAWRFIGHRLLPRVVLPWALVGTLASSAVLRGPLYRVAFGAQVLGYAAGLAGVALEGRGGRWLRAPAAFAALNVAGLVGTIRYFTSPTARLWAAGPRGLGVPATTRRGAPGPAAPAGEPVAAGRLAGSRP
jgi:hypothetical protein